MSGRLLVEDWHGRYWDRVKRSYQRRCTCEDPDLFDYVTIARGDLGNDHWAGWYWEHLDDGDGPFDHWQEAAQSAAEAGVLDVGDRP